MADSDRWEGLGVPPGMLKPGLAVMVATGRIPAVVNGGPSVICLATVLGKASPEDAAQMVDPNAMWWLNVHTGPGVTLPQMYPAWEILGVPALGLAMPDLTKAESRLPEE